MSTYSVYAVLDANDEVIYVGRTRNLKSRIQQHATGQSWGREIAGHKVLLETDDAEQARQCEHEQIRTRRPRHNVQLNPDVRQGSSGKFVQIDPASVVMLRELAGLSQTNLAVMAGIDRPNFAHIEAGRRKATTIQVRRIAEALEVPLDSIIKRVAA